MFDNQQGVGCRQVEFRTFLQSIDLSMYMIGQATTW